MEDRGRALREVLRGLRLAQDGWERGDEAWTARSWALVELLRAPDVTASELRERLGVDLANVSRLCARLEEDGELRRVEDPQDKRVRRLRLTAKGERSARALEGSSAARSAALAEALGGHEADVIEALRRLTEALRAG